MGEVLWPHAELGTRLSRFDSWLPHHLQRGPRVPDHGALAQSWQRRSVQNRDSLGSSPRGATEGTYPNRQRKRPEVPSSAGSSPAVPTNFIPMPVDPDSGLRSLMARFDS